MSGRSCLQFATRDKWVHQVGLLSKTVIPNSMESDISSLDILTILTATVRDASFWTGLATVFVFSQGRFSEKQIDDENIDPPLPARCFTTRFRYYSSALVFAGVYVALFVCLIIIGSIPAFQDILKPLFGSLHDVPADVAGGGKQNIGTPAWAAMIVMVIAPTVPWINRSERLLRLWLQEFSDTPFKARGLADEIIQNLLVSTGAPPNLDHASEENLVALFGRLEELRHQLTSSGRWRRDQSYRDFYAQNGELLARTTDRFRALEWEIGTQANRKTRSSNNHHRRTWSAAAHPYRTQMATLVQRLGRLLACALLYSEIEEYAVRERLRHMSNMSNLAPATFRFTAAQVILAIVFSALIAGFSGPVSSLLNNKFIMGAQLDWDQMVEQIKIWAPISVVIAIAFTLPLLLVAAIRLYLIDIRNQDCEDLNWDQTTVILLFAFIGCFGLATLPSVAYLAYAYTVAPNVNQGYLATGVLWALPPAIINTAFIHCSEIRWGHSKWQNWLVDFSMFCVLGTLVALLTGASLAVVHLTVYGTSFHDEFQLEIPLMVTLAVVSISNGMLHCSTSRVKRVTADGSASGQVTMLVSRPAVLPSAKPAN
jgi:hypothetical protein